MKNWRGLESHWTDSYLNWRVTDKEMLSIRGKADALTSGHKVTVKQLEDFIRDMREQVVLDEADSNADASI